MTRQTRDLGDPRRPPRVAVLGRTTVDGEGLTARQRAIVAMLALRGESGATTDALIDAVWHGGAPRAARQSLHNQITRLRRRFGADLVVTGPDSYRLGATVDVDDFHRTVSTWIERPAGTASVDPLRRALALWRGTPYLDLSEHPAVGAERAGLCELRARALETLAVSLLVTDDGGGATIELERLLEEEPYREQAWGLLLVALHRDGRRAQALSAYERASERFVRELGVRPSTALQRLSARIADDEVLDVSDWVTVPLDLPGAGRRGHDQGSTARTRCRDHRSVRDPS